MSQEKCVAKKPTQQKPPEPPVEPAESKTALEIDKLTTEVALLKKPRVWPIVVPMIPATILALATVYLAFSSGLLDMQRLVLKNETTLLQIDKAKVTEELAQVKTELQHASTELKAFKDEDQAIKTIRKRFPWSTIKFGHQQEGSDEISLGVELKASVWAIFGGIPETGQFHPETTTVITQAAKFRNLQSLTIEGILLTPEDMKAIWNLRTITNLALSNNRITDDMLQGFPSFERLDQLSITKQPLKKLRLPPLHKLSGLYLGGTFITDEELRQSLPAVPNLKGLDLKQTHLITDAVVPHITKLSHLQYVNLEGTALTPQGIKALALHPSVTIVQVYSGAISQQEIDAIRKTKPTISLNTTKPGS
jgi:hypothetical protein